MDHRDDRRREAERPASELMRLVAVAATAVALLAISIPFVWQPHVDAAPASPPAHR